MEAKTLSFFKKEEEQWILKSRVIWLKEGDNNTKYFHQYANLSNNINTISNIKKEEDGLVLSFEEKEDLRVN
jgi:hypothetical protein